MAWLLFLTLKGVIGAPMCWTGPQSAPSVVIMSQNQGLSELFLYPFLDIIIPLFLSSSHPPMSNQFLEELSLDDHLIILHGHTISAPFFFHCAAVFYCVPDHQWWGQGMRYPGWYHGILFPVLVSFFVAHLWVFMFRMHAGI